MKRALLLDGADNVATALEDIQAGEIALVRISNQSREVRVIADIPFGHKFAVRRIPKDGDVIKYGEVIGRATRDIEVGDWVHVHNVVSNRGRGDLLKGEGGGR